MVFCWTNRRQVEELFSSLKHFSTFSSSSRDRIVQDLGDLVKRQGGDARNQQLNYNGAQGYQMLVCYECREEGHIKKNCQLPIMVVGTKSAAIESKATKERKP